MMAGEEVLDNIIETYISREIEKIMQNENSQDNSSSGSYFYSSEFKASYLPQEKKGLVAKAIDWIKQRQEIKDNKNSDRNDKRKKEETER